MVMGMMAISGGEVVEAAFSRTELDGRVGWQSWMAELDGANAAVVPHGRGKGTREWIIDKEA